MKKILTLLAAVSLASTAFFAQAATPKAAEEPTATVVSADAPAPRAHKVAKKTKKAKKHAVAHKKHGKKHHHRRAHRAR